MVDFLLICIGTTIGVPSGLYISRIFLKLFLNIREPNKSSKDISFDDFINNKS